MNINLTLILQSIAMMVFVWFCMKYVWPPILQAMEERRAKIAEGLAASDEAAKALDAAQQEVDGLLKDARLQANQIVDQANQRGTQVFDEAKQEAVAERQRQVTAAEADIQQSANQAKEELRKTVAALVVAGAEKVIEKEIDPNAHNALLEKLIEEI